MKKQKIIINKTIKKVIKKKFFFLGLKYRPVIAKPYKAKSGKQKLKPGIITQSVFKNIYQNIRKKASWKRKDYYFLFQEANKRKIIQNNTSNKFLANLSFVKKKLLVENYRYAFEKAHRRKKNVARRLRRKRYLKLGNITYTRKLFATNYLKLFYKMLPSLSYLRTFLLLRLRQPHTLWRHQTRVMLKDSLRKLSQKYYLLHRQMYYRKKYRRNVKIPRRKAIKKFPVEFLNLLSTRKILTAEQNKAKRLISKRKRVARLFRYLFKYKTLPAAHKINSKKTLSKFKQFYKINEEKFLSRLLYHDKYKPRKKPVWMQKKHFKNKYYNRNDNKANKKSYTQNFTKQYSGKYNQNYAKDNAKKFFQNYNKNASENYSQSYSKNIIKNKTAVQKHAQTYTKDIIKNNNKAPQVYNKSNITNNTRKTFNGYDKSNVGNAPDRTLASLLLPNKSVPDRTLSSLLINLAADLKGKPYKAEKNKKQLQNKQVNIVLPISEQQNDTKTSKVEINKQLAELRDIFKNLK